MTRRPIVAAAAAVSALLATAPLLAQLKPADAVRARIAGYRELGASFKNVNDGLRSAAPQTVVIQMSAREIANTARAQYGWFPAGSGPQPGVKTAAKADIWAQPARFKQAQDAFAAQAAKFQQVARAGDPAAMRAASRALGATCKGCHDQFRVADR